MNALTTFAGGNVATMTSFEIAELVESRHDKVKQSIERLAERGVISLPPMGGVKIQRERREEAVSVYQVGKRDSYIIVAQLSPEFTARLVDRWQELEARQSDPMQVLSDPAAMRGLLLTYTEKVIELESKVKEDAPKVEFAMAVRRMEGTCKIGDFCKAIGYGRNTLFQKLREDGILMKDNRPYQRYIDNGLMDVIENDPFTDKNGKAHPTFTPVVTGKGQVWLEKKYRRYFVVKAVAA